MLSNCASPSSAPKARALFMALALVIAFCTPAFAHKASIFAYEEGGQLKMECSFTGGAPCMNSSITITDNATGKILGTTKTDRKGKASYPIPAEARKNRLDLKMILNAGQGHRGIWIIKADEYLGEAPGSQSAAASATTTAPTQEVSTQASLATGVSLDAATLSRIVDKSLDRRLAPINRRLAALTEPGPKVSDIFGGIGYILGLFGIAALVTSRKRSGR